MNSEKPKENTEIKPEQIIRTKFVYGFAHEVKDMLIKRSENPELPLLTMPKLNTKLWGLKPGRMTIIGARTSQGKSAFALQMSLDLAMQKHRVLFLSLEMSTEDMIERLFCNYMKVDNYELLKGAYAKDEAIRSKYAEFMATMYSVPLVMSDCIGYTWQEIEALILKIDETPKVIVVDYIQAIKKSSVMSREAIDEYIRNLRELAIRHNFAVILCSQVNRDSQNDPNNKDKEPRLHHLKSSGFLEEHADAVILLHWPYKYHGDDIRINDFKLFLEKNRNGRTGIVNLRYIPEFYRFEDEQEEPTQEVKDVIKELNQTKSQRSIQQRRNYAD